MVRFVDVANMTKWIAQDGVEPIITGMVDYLEQDFLRWELFDKTSRVPSHSDSGVIELMPTSDGDTYAFKYVNGHPLNPSRGFQTVTAFGVLANVSNGYPTFWSEMTLLTALRTGATSAMVARLLARPDSSTLALIGAGTQSEFQALAFRAILGITEIRIWDTDPAAMEKFARNMAPLGFDIVVATSAREAVRGADIVTTCTADKANATIVTNDMIEPGMHLNAIGGDCPGKTELDAEILRRATVFVEFPPQTRVEGEIQQLDADSPITELWQVMAGRAAGRTSAEQVTVFDSVGFAIEDFSALRYVRDAVDGTGFYDEVDLIANPADPKDLFGLVTAAAPVLV
ncbi:ornithine cyclodeaminase [Cryobacterium psychrophilum]|uniref:Ornithine cyclodeaminase n=1 Tax=Cryobacterium psychrophilum TaxID=41988 RepID=A0A4Y8KQG1_9MICO|nr:ornithine cyclodeaminase [Cryobacterium psychrophilum]TDW29493.1 ornithine cyclodeaminase [Cryobacterium psychrophilum]TFD81375.1 ornithine cyclodeaminase [Cryobacterium psychrophilum]